MRSCMTEGSLCLLIVLKGEELKLAVARDRGSEILILAVDLADTNSLVKTHAYALSDFHSGCAVFILLNDAAFQCYVCHFIIIPFMF